MIQLLA